MKRGIPEPGKIAKDARECVQECVSEFISFITSEASDRCHMEKRKTINGEDILFAMTTLGFDNYVEPLKLYLQKYREVCIRKPPHAPQNCFILSVSSCADLTCSKYMLLNCWGLGI
jgi:nuclear transcription Y subunit beta